MDVVGGLCHDRRYGCFLTLCDWSSCGTRENRDNVGVKVYLCIGIIAIVKQIKRLGYVRDFGEGGLRCAPARASSQAKTSRHGATALRCAWRLLYVSTASGWYKVHCVSTLRIRHHRLPSSSSCSGPFFSCPRLDPWDPRSSPARRQPWTRCR
jgi:hypothetical protein